MVAVISILIFSGACATSIAVMAVSIAPQWRRILSLAAGNVETSFAPLAELRTAERRIAVRRWASEAVPAPIARLRVAA